MLILNFTQKKLAFVQFIRAAVALNKSHLPSIFPFRKIVTEPQTIQNIASTVDDNELNDSSSTQHLPTYDLYDVLFLWKRFL